MAMAGMPSSLARLAVMLMLVCQLLAAGSVSAAAAAPTAYVRRRLVEQMSADEAYARSLAEEEGYNTP